MSSLAPRSQEINVGDDSFDALVDLLASDDLGDSADTSAGVFLRDASGRLDFEKIRGFLVSRSSASSGDRASDSSAVVVSPPQDRLDDGATSSVGYFSIARVAKNPRFSNKVDLLAWEP
jgi:hypothetical protein